LSLIGEMIGRPAPGDDGSRIDAGAGDDVILDRETLHRRYRLHGFAGGALP
jgi:hypothetical protein